MESAFLPTGGGDSILAERAHWLDTDPARYAAALPDAEPLLAEAHAFAAAANPGLACAPDAALLGRRWEPDFLILAVDAKGLFTLRAGCVCFPSHWDLGEKLGRPLAAIHEPVPTLNAVLARQIDAFLAALRPGAVWERWNWGLAATPERNNHPARELPRVTPELELDQLWLRSEHQAFARLEATGAILFGIRIDLQPLADFTREAATAAHLADLLATMPDDIARYKGIGSARDSIVHSLREAGGHTTG